MENQKSQPWLFNPVSDFAGILALPLILCFTLLILERSAAVALFQSLFFYILIVDFGHIFAQWFRIFSNPMETRKSKTRYICFCVSTYFVIGAILMAPTLEAVRSFTIYLVIWHFVKQQYGYIRIYSRTDGPKSKVVERLEKFFIQASMFYPVFYSHYRPELKGFYWESGYIHIPEGPGSVVNALFAASVIGAGCFYCYHEYKRSKKNAMFNWPKNLALLGGLLGWNLAVFMSRGNSTIFFTVVLVHDMTYIMMVWLTGRRDRKLQTADSNPKEWQEWLRWTSPLGFVWYFFTLNLVGLIVICAYYQIEKGHLAYEVFFGDFFSALPSLKDTAFSGFGTSIFFTTQVTHYVMDGYLWKKEKDYKFHLAQAKSESFTQERNRGEQFNNVV